MPSRDIVLADHSGHSLGFRNGSEWILNEAEWENAIIRSENSNAEVIDLEIQAISRQIENGRVAAAKVEKLRWLASPLIIDEIESVVNILDENQIAGETMDIEVMMKIPKSTKTAEISLIIPKGNNVLVNGEEIKKREKTVIGMSLLVAKCTKLVEI